MPILNSASNISASSLNAPLLSSGSNISVSSLTSSIISSGSNLSISNYAYTLMGSASNMSVAVGRILNSGSNQSVGHGLGVYSCISAPLPFAEIVKSCISPRISTITRVVSCISPSVTTLDIVKSCISPRILTGVDTIYSCINPLVNTPFPVFSCFDSIISTSIVTQNQEYQCIYDSNGTTYNASRLSVKWSIDSGWDVSMTIPQKVERFNYENNLWRIELVDRRGNRLFTPWMICIDRSVSFNNCYEVTNMQFKDYTTWKLAKDGVSFPCFTKSSSTAIVSAIASHANVSIGGISDWRVNQEEIKFSKLMDPLMRLSEAEGKVYVVEQDGSVSFKTYNSKLGCDSGYVLGYDIQDRDSLKINKFTFGKTTTVRNSGSECFTTPGYKEIRFPNRLKGVSVTVTRKFPGDAYFGYIFDDDERIVDAFRFQGEPVPPTQPIFYGEWGTKMRILIVGQVPNTQGQSTVDVCISYRGIADEDVLSGTDLSFITSYTAPWGEAERPIDEPITNNLWPNEEFIASRALDYAVWYNRDVSSIRMQVDPSVMYWPLKWHVVCGDNYGCRIQSITWNVDGCKMSTEIEGEYLHNVVC